MKALFDGTESRDNIEVMNWTWTFEYNDMSVVLYGTEPTFTFDLAGVFYVTLNTSDSAGNWALDVVTVTVIDITKPHAVAGKNLTITQNEIIKFDGTGSYDNVDIVNWTWTIDLDGEKTLLYGPTTIWNFTEVGNYTVTLVVKDDEDNRASNSFWINVTSNEQEDIEPPDDDTTKTRDEISLPISTVIGIVVGIIILIIILIVVLFLFLKRKKKEEQKKEELEKSEPQVLQTPLLPTSQPPQLQTLPPINQSQQSKQISQTLPIQQSPALPQLPPGAPIFQQSPAIPYSIPLQPTTTITPQTGIPTTDNQTITQKTNQTAPQPETETIQTKSEDTPGAPICTKCGGLISKFQDGSSLCTKCGSVEE
jgi:heme/copper-type cytochrome/quinol oxidase subunit 2